MSVQVHSTARPVPSSILHNGTNARSEYTRLAAAQARNAAAQKLQAVYNRLRNRAAWQNPALPEG